MMHTQQLAPGLQPVHPLIATIRRLRPILIAILAIGLATGAAFVALVWLDGSMRFLTPSVIRLGSTAPAGLPRYDVASAQAAT